MAGLSRHKGFLIHYGFKMMIKNKMIKKIMRVVLIMCISSNALSAVAYSATSWKYKNNPDGIEVNEYAGSDTTVTIPSSIDGYKVTGIASEKYMLSGVFSNRVSNVNIPNSVKTIGVFAFYKCSNLQSIVIPDSVTEIKMCAFNSCSSLTKVTIGSGVKNIESAAFDNCINLKSVIIPNSVTSIEDFAFGFYTDSNGDTKRVDAFKIYGTSGSSAQKYANDNGFTFVDINNPKTKNGLIVGDLNGDGTVNSSDAVIIKQYLAGYEVDSKYLEAFDVNDDGKVDATDAVLLSQKLAGYDVILG